MVRRCLQALRQWLGRRGAIPHLLQFACQCAHWQGQAFSNCIVAYLQQKLSPPFSAETSGIVPLAVFLNSELPLTYLGQHSGVQTRMVGAGCRGGKQTARPPGDLKGAHKARAARQGGHTPSLCGPKGAVPRVPKPWDDEALIVHLRVDHGGVNLEPCRQQQEKQHHHHQAKCPSKVPWPPSPPSLGALHAFSWFARTLPAHLLE